MNPEFNYKNGEKVEYDNGVFKGQGKVIGCASTEMAVIGRQYIVQDLSGNVPNATYPFSAFPLFETDMKKITKTKTKKV